jgi:hypothetical protein
VKPLFPTLAAAGYTKCEHPRINQKAPTPYCRDCGYASSVSSDMDFPREPIE